MNIEFIVGTILTVFFGILSYYQSRKESPTRLIIVVDEIINLYADITKSIKGIEVRYNEEQIKENMYLIKAYIFCFGEKDIQKQDIIKPIDINLTNNSVWKDCKIVDKTAGLDVTSQYIDNSILFDFDLLKNGDFFCFQSLCELKQKNPSYENVFTINHRIANIGKVITLNYKGDIVPTYAPILSWICSAAISYFLFLPALKFYNYDKDNFSANYYIDNKVFNADSINALKIRKAKIKVDSINRLVRKSKIKLETAENRLKVFRKKLDLESYNEYHSIYKDYQKVSDLDLKYSLAKIDIDSKFNIFKINLNTTVPKADSIFNEFAKEYTYLYFLVNSRTPSIKIDKNYSVSYTLTNKIELYMALGAIGLTIILFFLSYLITNRYLAYKAILVEINRVRKNTEIS